MTIADTFPLSIIDEIIDELGHSDTFTILDVRVAYWSVEVHPEDRPNTTFSDGIDFSSFVDFLVVLALHLPPYRE